MGEGGRGGKGKKSNQAQLFIFIVHAPLICMNPSSLVQKIKRAPGKNLRGGSRVIKSEISTRFYDFACRTLGAFPFSLPTYVHMYKYSINYLNSHINSTYVCRAMFSPRPPPSRPRRRIFLFFLFFFFNLKKELWSKTGVTDYIPKNLLSPPPPPRLTPTSPAANCRVLDGEGLRDDRTDRTHVFPAGLQSTLTVKRGGRGSKLTSQRG